MYDTAFVFVTGLFVQKHHEEFVDVYYRFCWCLFQNLLTKACEFLSLMFHPFWQSKTTHVHTLARVHTARTHAHTHAPHAKRSRSPHLGKQTESWANRLVSVLGWKSTPAPNWDYEPAEQRYTTFRERGTILVNGTVPKKDVIDRRTEQFSRKT